MRFEPTRWVLSLVSAATVVALSGGCAGRPAGPKTEPVNGRLVVKDSPVTLQRLNGGKIWFQSTTEPDTKAMGFIDEEGTFAVNLIAQIEGLEGVPAGLYKVRIEPPLDDQRRPQRGLIASRYLDFDQSGLTVEVPSPTDELVLELNPPAL